MKHGVQTIIYPVKDLAKAKAIFSQLLGVEPYMDQPYYVGYAVEGQQIGLETAGWLPVNPNVTIDSNPNLQVFADQFALGTPFPNRAELSQFWTPMADAITAVSAGGETPADATAAAYEIIQKGIDELHAAAGS